MHGRDWSLNFPNCAGGTQSPLNLVSELSPDFNYFKVRNKVDEFDKNYAQQIKRPV